ncbi:MAG TPA: tRNA (N6-isopentenyl adenosine(37)-C2)-methylthiotransferase MiaB [Candidatus Acidoferrum sp.]|jgi:tRNA-2-methylthio-N6-dimethylallyladenosine synthase
MGNSFDISVEMLTGEVLGSAKPVRTGGALTSESGQPAMLTDRLKRRSQYAQKRNAKNLGDGEKSQEGSLAALRMTDLDGRVRGDAVVVPGRTAEGNATFYLETFGCQMNDHDSEKVAGVLLARGYAQVERPEDAGVILYNTCSIREKAAQKVFSRLGEYRFTKKEGQVIGVLGCVAQQEGEAIFERAPWVSLVCGSASYRKLPEMIAELEAGNKRVAGLDTDTDETFETPITRRDNPWRAYLTIIEGCDKACSYCVVPFTRGPERSRASASVLEEVRQLADLGYTEVQLLGQTVNSYADPSARKMRFSDLLVAVAETPRIRRVRFTTSHPRDFGQDIVEAIEAYPAICNHVHLPVQSGSTALLRAMARTYTRDEYLQKIAMLHRAKREISITTDIIVGFPGETEKDLEETLSLLDAAQYDLVYAFKYSPRPNTPSLKMEDAIPEQEKSRRLAALNSKQQSIQVARNAELAGKRFEVLVEGKSRRENQWTGHTSCNRILNFTSPERDILGHYRQIRVTSAGANSLVGEAE